VSKQSDEVMITAYDSLLGYLIIGMINKEKAKTQI
jgi:hypothetical protein